MHSPGPTFAQIEAERKKQYRKNNPKDDNWVKCYLK